MTVTEETYVLCYVMMQLPGGGDFLLTCWREETDPKDRWKFEYRFRYYRDAKVFDSDDIKNYYTGTATGPEAEVIAKLQAVIGATEKCLNQKAEWTCVRGGHEQFFEAISKDPNFHRQDSVIE